MGAGAKCGGLAAVVVRAGGWVQDEPDRLTEGAAGSDKVGLPLQGDLEGADLEGRS